MKRRKALQYFSFTVAGMLTGPSVFSLLQSCQSDSGSQLGSGFLSSKAYFLLEQYVDTLIPETEIPGALSMKVPQFIEKYVQKVLPLKESKAFKAWFVSLEKYTLSLSNHNRLKDLKKDVFVQSLDNLLALGEKEKKKIDHYFQNPSSSDELSDKQFSYFLIEKIKEMAVYAFKNSEYIGKNVLAYVPNPGKQAGCVSLKEATGGYDWSL